MANFGTLTDVQILGEDLYYKLVVGENCNGEVRQVLTRGAGRNYGATCIPICVKPSAIPEIGKNVVMWTRRELAIHEVLETIDINALSVLLVKMPREGNLVSGWEWNAPGGTGEPGESPEEIASREFSEETDLAVLYTGSSFPDWLQFASGCYDEVQTISFALVTGNPTKLVEGAVEWTSIPLRDFAALSWACNDSECRPASSKKFVPIDGKVYFAVSWLCQYLRLREMQRKMGSDVTCPRD